MLPVLIGLAMFVLAFAIPYHAPRLGILGGAAGMALAFVLVRYAPVNPGDPPRAHAPLDFELSRPIGIALALYALIWLLISAVQLTRVRTPVH